MPIPDTEKKSMIKTARSNGAVGKNAVLPRFISEIPDLKPHLILDFGCGKEAIHVQMLRRQGFEFVYGIDLEPLGDPNLEANTCALPWHLVYASNVLNVQPSRTALYCTLDKIARFAKVGVAYLSYPKTPRKMGLSDEEMLRCITIFFQAVYKFKIRNTTIFKCVGNKCRKELENRLTDFVESDRM